jgi:hypothetical protein
VTETHQFAIEPGSRNVRRSSNNQTRTPRSKHGTALSTRYSTLADRACRWLFPWSAHNYPGFLRGLRAVLDRTLTPGGILHWRAGRRRMPPWAAERIATEIERRCREGQAIASELREYIRDWRPYDRSHPRSSGSTPSRGRAGDSAARRICCGG